MRWNSPFSLSRLDRQSGSVQVVEFSWVFPVAACVVLALMYLSFLLFFYVYSFHIVELTADETLHELQSTSSLIQQLDPQEATTIGAEQNFYEKIRKLKFLPGIHFTPEFQTGTFGKSISVKLGCSYFGKQMFCVKAERQVLSPVEYAKKMDLLDFMKRM